MTVHKMVRPLNFAGYNVPEHTQGALRRYVEQGMYPGGFLEAVLTNNLMAAVARADSENQAALIGICMFVYNEVPSAAWGNVDKMHEWCKLVLDPGPEAA